MKSRGLLCQKHRAQALFQLLGEVRGGLSAPRSGQFLQSHRLVRRNVQLHGGHHQASRRVSLPRMNFNAGMAKESTATASSTRVSGLL